MDRHSKFRLLAVSAALAAACGVASAQTSRGDNVAFTTGGIGLEARQAMLAQAGQYNLHLEFAEAADGEYVSGVDVTIVSARGGNVLSTRTEGPWLFANLPPGSYTVTARYGGTTRQQHISVGPGRRHIVMRFPQGADQVAADFSAGRR